MAAHVGPKTVAIQSDSKTEGMRLPATCILELRKFFSRVTTGGGGPVQWNHFP